MVRVQRARVLPRQPGIRGIHRRNVSTRLPIPSVVSMVLTIHFDISRYGGRRRVCSEPPISPFYDRVTIHLPNALQPLVITADGAPTKPYIKSVALNGRNLDGPILSHADIASGGNIVFEMSETPQAWGSATLAKAGDDL